MKKPESHAIALPLLIILAAATATPLHAAEAPRVGEKIRFLERGLFSSRVHEGTVKAIQKDGKVRIGYVGFNGEIQLSQSMTAEVNPDDLLLKQDPLSRYKIGDKISYKTRRHSYAVTDEIFGFTQDGQLVFSSCDTDNPDRIRKCETNIMDRTQVSDPAQASGRLTKDVRATGLSIGAQGSSASSGNTDSGGL